MPTNESSVWNTSQKVIFRFGFIFVLLFLLTCPFSYSVLPDTGKFLSPFFESLVTFSGNNILHLKKPYTARILSDATGMYIHVLNVLILALIGSIIWSVSDKKRSNYIRLKYWFIAVISYYLSLQMLIYGFNKIFKWQFYFPEPNTLFTNIGNAPKDLLYWSSMGASYSYVLFMGIVEVAGALLLLFRSTRALGGLILTGVLINVVIVNFSYDISVKCYSLFLLLVSIIISAPAFRLLFIFFIRNRVVMPLPFATVIFKRKRFRILLKSIAVFLILTESLLIYIQTRNFNDDKFLRPPLYGAWKVFSFSRNRNAVIRNDDWKRFFVHRRGYFIVQNNEDEMRDYKLEYDIPNQQLILKDYYTKQHYTFQYDNIGTDTLLLNGVMENDNIQISATFIPLDSLPLKQSGFHWTIDE